jgi:ribonuclease P protein component
MKKSLRGSRDFQKVYRSGRRYEGSLLTVFVLPNSCAFNRLGITASKKALGKAYERNRAKRLLRETFRLSGCSLNKLQRRYDWVLNGRRRLLSSKLKSSLGEFERIIGAVAADEIVCEVNRREDTSDFTSKVL